MNCQKPIRTQSYKTTPSSFIDSRRGSKEQGRQLACLQTFELAAKKGFLVPTQISVGFTGDGYPRGKPSPAVRAANQEHGARAAIWYRHQHVVDFEVAVGRERDTAERGVVRNNGSRGFTNQSG